ncbi:hypothetical protein BGZ63DRAFT_373688 [Mariannaea sp. PMI_226]|nr:hypothetical protein BGZ63DRAFT_373688 [Mariannaea sp. PMI_226]
MNRDMLQTRPHPSNQAINRREPTKFYEIENDPSIVQGRVEVFSSYTMVEIFKTKPVLLLRVERTDRGVYGNGLGPYTDC